MFNKIAEINEPVSQAIEDNSKTLKVLKKLSQLLFKPKREIVGTVACFVFASLILWVPIIVDLVALYAYVWVTFFPHDKHLIPTEPIPLVNGVSSTLISQYYGYIQANDQFSLPVGLLIQQVTAASIIVSFHDGVIEIPRLFSKIRKFKNVFICLYDEMFEDRACEDRCDNMKAKLNLTEDLFIKQSFNERRDLWKLKDASFSANTTYLTFVGHSSPGYIGLARYDEFIESVLGPISPKTDNIIISISSCYSGGFYPKQPLHYQMMNKVRVLATSTPNGLTLNYCLKHEVEVMCMFTTGIYDLGPKMNFHVNRSNLLNYKVFGELENIRMNKIYEPERKIYSYNGIYIKWGHAIRLEHYTTPQIQNIELSECYGKLKNAWTDLWINVQTRNTNPLFELI